ncbi:MAG: hypothetical protein CVV11_06570 [Gammaproteobacteria bacterium HGW-Gammaproteobacteria-15]|nr:MAG: hypothetical protein CVV11_06570 [Gammaproteobacteria bacterium HGW-Gammaproteobacteria-15]
MLERSLQGCIYDVSACNKLPKLTLQKSAAGRQLNKASAAWMRQRSLQGRIYDVFVCCLTVEPKPDGVQMGRVRQGYR